MGLTLWGIFKCGGSTNIKKIVGLMSVLLLVTFVVFLDVLTP
jgi:hypothetical protein